MAISDPEADHKLGRGRALRTVTSMFG